MNKVRIMNYLKKFNLKFYKTKEWLDKRQEMLIRDNYECQMCKAKGRVSKATTVHHIKHYKDHPYLALTDDNLMSVCEVCHNKLHPEKGFKHEKKKEIHAERWG